ncbi:sigma-54-dependent transcriptional regulator [Puniceibacterium sediminis]|uniref:Two component, sigma54 specific, transcriptional regulator, Fis family n=1 Tax=Puniceibacterium sediminis TaxID=1608407 RepID=A0A238WUM0_9RHOB|nr:sigma-54 dependent transcriptional regulator [Puniceibacterium sediminis]SNR50133.1 two component, sigma54 specific, transcriptional regulator, Fis family [Puniceibacterium sediminis]
MTKAVIWVVDDDDDHREGLRDLIAQAGHSPVAFDGATDALDAMAVSIPDIILSDLRMPGLDGIAFLKAVRERGAEVPLILLTGHGDVGQAVRAMQMGAQDFLEKPYDADHLLSVVDRSLEAARLTAENAALRQSLQALQPHLLGNTTAITALRNRLEQIAPLDVDVILQGETGTGKELAARILHQSGPRRTGPFVTINCAALHATGFESDLFGLLLEDGSLRPGRIAAAEGGTLFLDQIDVMPLPLQPRLLRFMQTRCIELGGAAIPVDIRIVAAASADLRELIALGRFRQDMFYRLADVEIPLPPLREIPADIPILFAHFVTEAAARHGLPESEITFADRKALMRHHWPGNAHELRQAALRRVMGLEGSVAETIRAPGSSLKDRVLHFEAMEIARVLDQFKGNTAKAAQELGIPRRTLTAKMSRSAHRPAD